MQPREEKEMIITSPPILVRTPGPSLPTLPSPPLSPAIHCPIPQTTAVSHYTQLPPNHPALHAANTQIVSSPGLQPHRMGFRLPQHPLHVQQHQQLLPQATIPMRHALLETPRVQNELIKPPPLISDPPIRKQGLPPPPPPPLLPDPPSPSRHSLLSPPSSVSTSSSLVAPARHNSKHDSVKRRVPSTCSKQEIPASDVPNTRTPVNNESTTRGLSTSDRVKMYLEDVGPSAANRLPVQSATRKRDGINKSNDERVVVMKKHNAAVPISQNPPPPLPPTLPSPRPRAAVPPQYRARENRGVGVVRNMLPGTSLLPTPPGPPPPLPLPPPPQPVSIDGNVMIARSIGAPGLIATPPPPPPPRPPSHPLLQSPGTYSVIQGAPSRIRTVKGLPVPIFQMPNPPPAPPPAAVNRVIYRPDIGLGGGHVITRRAPGDGHVIELENNVQVFCCLHYVQMLIGA